MVEISKMSGAAVMHLFAEVSLLEMDWVDTMVQSAQYLAKNFVWLNLATCDQVLFKAVKMAAKKNESSEKKVNFPFFGADQTTKDYSVAADSVLRLLNQPLSPVKIFCEKIHLEIDEKNRASITSEGFDYH